MRKRIAFFLALSIVMSLFGFPLSVSAAAQISTALYNGAPDHSVSFVIDDIAAGVAEITVGVERGPGQTQINAITLPTNGNSSVSGRIFTGALSAANYYLVVFPGGASRRIDRPETHNLGLSVIPTTPPASGTAGEAISVTFTIDRDGYTGPLTITSAAPNAWMPALSVPESTSPTQTISGIVTIPPGTTASTYSVLFTVTRAATLPDHITVNPAAATLAVTVTGEIDPQPTPQPTPQPPPQPPPPPPPPPAPPSGGWHAPPPPPNPGLPPLGDRDRDVTIQTTIPVNNDAFRIVARVRSNRITTSFPASHIEQAVETSVSGNVIFGLADLPDAISITFARAAIMRFANEGLGMRFDSTHGQMLLSAIDVANLPGEQRVGAITIYLDFGMGVTIPDDPPPPDQIINVLRFEIDSRNFSINDVPVGTLDAAPFIEGDRTMVPLRVVGERMGATVGWIESTRTVTISGFGQSLQLPVDSPLPGGMGMPIIVADRTFVPLRYVSETLGAYVRWDAGARVVYVYL